MSRVFKALERAESEHRNGFHASPLLAALPRPRRAEPAAADEAHETLKAMLGLLADRSDLRSVLFASVGPGAGAAPLILPLAGSMAAGAAGGILVVDADPAASTLGYRLDTAREWGLSDVVVRKVRAGDAVAASATPRLHFLGPGCSAVDYSHPRSLVLLQQALGELTSLFDRLLIDGGFVERSSQVFLLASRVDGVVLVVEAERTPIAAARQAVARLREGNVRLLGVVLTGRRHYVPDFVARRLS